MISRVRSAGEGGRYPSRALRTRPLDESFCVGTSRTHSTRSFVKRHDCPSTTLAARMIAWLIGLAAVLLETGAVLEWGRTPTSAAGSSQETAQVAPSPTARRPAIKLHREGKDAGKTAFTVTGLDAAVLAGLAKAKLSAEQWTALFAVYVD